MHNVKPGDPAAPRAFTFRPCSGQSRKRGGRDWGVWAEGAPESWRLRQKDGRRRLFTSWETAQRVADHLNAVGAVPVWNTSPPRPLFPPIFS